MPNKPILQFLHANAYPPGCYRQLLKPFEADFQIETPLQRPLLSGYDPRDLNSWYQFSDDLIKDMKGRDKEQVIGMGHSLGAVVSWLASMESPNLFSRLILIDPVFLPRRIVWAQPLVPYAVKKKIVPIVKTALNRRASWADKATVRKHYASKKIFQRFDPQVFDDFIEFGIEEKEDGVGLVFDPEWEARIYATAPNLWPLLSKSSVKLLVIRGKHSDVILPKAWKRMKGNIPNADFVEIPDSGHLVPLEKPGSVSEIILDWLDK